MHLRISKPNGTQSSEAIQFGSFIFDPAAHILTNESGRKVALTRAEFSLLEAFLLSPGRVLSRDFLLTAISGRDAKPFDRTVDVLVGRLRRKLGSSQIVTTVPGAGYRFALRSQAIEASTSAPNPTPHRTERRQVTVLSCQLPGLTALTAQIEPDALAELAAGFRQRCSSTVLRFGGLVTHPLPDGLVAYFGFPQANEFSAISAVRAALALTEAAISDAGQGLPAIGIATGQVVFGTPIDASTAATPQTIGEPIRLAASLCERAGAGGVVIAMSTWMLVEGAFQGEPVDPARSAWMVTAARPAPVVPPSRRPSRMVGRRRTMATLLEHWQAVKGGAGRVVLLSGEAGIGKSTLCASLSEQVGAAGRRALWAHCADQHKITFLHPFAVWLAEAAQSGRARSREQLVQQLAGLLATHHLPASELLLAGLLDPAAAEHPGPMSSPAQRRRQVATILLDLIQAVGGTAPFLFVVEDLQWADDASLEVLDLLVERSRRIPILAVLTMRSDFQPPWAGLPNVEHVQLGPLTARAAAAVIAGLDASQQLKDATVAMIVERAGGLPLFLEELTKATLGMTPASGTIPATLEDSLRSRIDRLGPGRTLVQAASIFGRAFHPVELDALTGFDPATLSAALHSLVMAEILESSTPQSTFAFRHELMRVAVYQWLTREERRALHERLAKSMASRADPAPQELAYHFEMAGDLAVSVAHRREAARRAMRQGPAVACDQLDEALRVLASMPSSRARDGTELDILLSLLEQQLAHFGAPSPQVRASLTRTVELCERLQRHAELAIGLNALFLSQWTASEQDEAAHTAGLMLHYADRATSPRATIVARRACGMAAFSQGDFDMAIGHYDEAYRLWRPRLIAEDPIASDPNTVLTVSGLVYALTITGQPARALDLMLDTIGLASEVDKPYFRVVALATECHFRQLRGEKQALAQAATELTAQAARCGSPLWTCLVKVFDGFARVQETACASHLAPMQEALADYRASGRLLHMPYYLGLVAEASSLAGRLDAAVAALDEAVAVADRTGERWYVAELWRIRGDVAGSLTERRSAYERAAATARRQGARLWHDRARQSAGLLLDRSDRRKARQTEV